MIDEHFYGENYSAAEYRAAGFNTLHFWPAIALADQIKFAKQNGFQAMPQIGTSPNASAMTEIVRPYAADLAVLGWFLEEEPTGAKGCFQPAHGGATPPTCETAWEAYLATKKGIKAVDAMHPIFNLDCAWTDVDAAGNDPRAWWHKWNSDGDVSCHGAPPSLPCSCILPRPNLSSCPGSTNLYVLLTTTTWPALIHIVRQLPVPGRRPA
eukprot:SAG22_NODE_5515_length_1001_cov_1.267184_1_plen_209_part_10